MPKADLFKGITNDHVLQAIKLIDDEGYPPLRRSTTYDLVYKNIAYPPKFVLSLAGHFRNKQFIDYRRFSGGEETAAFAHLRSLGFEILPKEKTKPLQKAKENADLHQKYVDYENQYMETPDFFTQTDIDNLRTFPGQKYDSDNPRHRKVYTALKETYSKIEYWGKETLARLFPEGDYHVVKKPTNQASKFENYLWVKLYPTAELKKWKKLAFTLTLSKDREDFCIKVDTVGGLAENDPIRKKYLEYRGDFFSSPIVKSLTIEEVLTKDWQWLINQSVATLKSLDKDYQKLLAVLREAKDLGKISHTQPTDFSFSLNTIFYGPPGTGKTYELNRIKVADFTDAGVSKTQGEALREILEEYPFWQVLGAALHSSKSPLAVTDLIEHPIIRARITPGIKTKPNNLAWADLQSYADDESTQLAAKYRRSIKLFHKDKDGKWSIAEDKKNDLPDIIDPTLLDLARDPYEAQQVQGAKEIRRYNFITFHQKYNYEDFIEGIKPLLKSKDEKEVDEIKNPSGQLAFELKKGVFYNSCLEALKLAGYYTFDDCYKDTKESRTEKFQRIKETRERQFAIFIDEINRANISAVFGELITLIEESKRLGEEEEMWIHLPYSGEPFAVPPNLYLIGSMNTADRSIALLDIALRRRFSFVGVYPKYDEIPDWKPLLKEINRKIFELKKNPDFFIGHAFFMNRSAEEKTDIFNTKIIPLLMEYFQNNTGIVKNILDAAGVATQEPSIDNNQQLIAE